jgi:hypothetical protein
MIHASLAWIIFIINKTGKVQYVAENTDFPHSFFNVHTKFHQNLSSGS